MPDEDKIEIGGGYPFAQLAKAFVTASTHDDPDTRDRALSRMDQWASVLRGMASGRLRVGSRTPVAGLPAWVTPTVVRGGFATGQAAAAGPLKDSERNLLNGARVPASREALFAYCLGEAGLVDLDARLSAGTYRVAIPEDAALLVVAWLVGANELSAAGALVEALSPFAGDLKFTPEPAPDAAAPRTVVWRQTGQQISEAVSKRRPNPRVEAMRESLLIWNPLTDDALDLWLATVDAGQVASTTPGGWVDDARQLLARYDQLATTHTLVSKHLRPKENLAILLRAMRAFVAGELDPRLRGLLQHAVDSMVARRGRPGSESHRDLRAAQQSVANLPRHHELARIVVQRMASASSDRGIESVDEFIAPVSPLESASSGVPAGSTIPPAIQRVVRRGLAATPEELIERGIVPSSEVLAALVPRISAATIAEAYDDPRLSELMAATYEAFRRRRTLLLLNLEHQVRFEELPWVSAVAHHRQRGDAAADTAAGSFARMAELALDAFPATILPSALISELDVLSREAQLNLPLVEELAADIFMGTFSAKFLRAAQIAADLLEGSLYARYYGIDYAQVRAIDDLTASRDRGPKTSAKFDALCVTRAGDDRKGFSVAANGTVLEQAQILTTHNLAAITTAPAVRHRNRLDWPALATRCFGQCMVLTERLHNNPRPLRTVKDLAYAWRQMIFFASMAADDSHRQLLIDARLALAKQPSHVVARLTPAIDGLARITEGGPTDAATLSNSPRRLLGWTTTRHWILDAD